MSKETSLVLEKDCFTLGMLFIRAAAHKGLALSVNPSCNPTSEVVKTYTLDKNLLALLAEQGIKQQDRSDCNNELFTLVDKNHQKPDPGFAASNYWNFGLAENSKDCFLKFDLRIDLRVVFFYRRKNRGIGLMPLASSPLVSPCDKLPNFRMFKALTDSDKEAPAVAREIASSDDGVAWVSWSDVGLGGIRTASELFDEFADGNQKVKNLALKEDLFDPPTHGNGARLVDKLFIVEQRQPTVFLAWKRQLLEYQKSLNLFVGDDC